MRCSRAQHRLSAAEPAQYSLAKMRLPQALRHHHGGGCCCRGRQQIDATIRISGVVAAAFDATGSGGQAHNHGTGSPGDCGAWQGSPAPRPPVKILACVPFRQPGPTQQHEHPQRTDWSGKQNAKSAI